MIDRDVDLARSTMAANRPAIAIDDVWDCSREGRHMGFLGALFDFSFTEFVTSKIISFIYILSVIGVALGYISFIIAGFSQGFFAGIGALIIGAIVALLILAYVRVVLEFFMVLFRIYENTRIMANQGYPHQSAAGSTPPYQPPVPPSGTATPNVGPQLQP